MTALDRAAAHLQNAGRELIRAGAALEEVGPPPGPPPPQPALTRLGGAVHREDMADRHAFSIAQDAAEGGIQVRVTYTRGVPDDWDDHPASGDRSLGATSSSLSVKTLSPGALRQFAHTIPQELRSGCLLTVWHEPEDNIRAGDFTLADWTAIQRTLADVGAELGIPTAACLMTWTWDPRSGRNPEDYREGCLAHDILTLDGYSESVDARPPDVFGPALASLREWGIADWAIRETGYLGGPDVLTWWTELWRWSADQGALFVAPWDSDRLANHPTRPRDWSISTEVWGHLAYLAAGG